jgi:hypothetical protein
MSLSIPGSAGRNRGAYVGLLAGTIALGLGSRHYEAMLPRFLSAYAGDTLWATAVFLVLAVIFHRARGSLLALLAVIVAFSVEFSQLWHPAWLVDIRATTAGALLLGTDFVWSDLACYAVGVGIGYGADVFVRR